MKSVCRPTTERGKNILSRVAGNCRFLFLVSAVVLPALVLLGVAGCRSPRPAEDETWMPELPLENYSRLEYLIQPSDLLDISVMGEPDLSQAARVSESGFISFPLLGEVRVAGRTAFELQKEMEKLLGRDFLVSPTVNIFIREYSTISVLGQVRRPGAYQLRGRMTVTEAIAQAGGLTETANPNRTRVIRRLNDEEEVITVRVKRILDRGNLSRDVMLQPGDLVVVPESFF